MRYRSVIDMHVVNRMQAFGWQPIMGAISLLLVLAIGAIVVGIILTLIIESS